MVQNNLVDNLKHIAYCNVAPTEFETLADTVNFCKMYLCKEYCIPFKDTIWDRYKDVEIIIEYFTILFLKNEKSIQDYKNSLSTNETDPNSFIDTEDDLFKWFEEASNENEKKLIEEAVEVEEINFNPEEI